MEQQTQSTLDVIYENWRGYNEKLGKAVAPLTNEQLWLQPAAHMWPLSQILQHIISVRAGWFSGTLQENDPVMNVYMETWASVIHQRAVRGNWYVASMRRGRSSKAAYSAGRLRSAL
jgi:uncharacterized damage-inducible protein DinB